MKSSLKLSSFLAAAFVALFLGVANYFLFNPHIVLFHWVGIYPVKSILIQQSIWLPFFTGYFSDMAWCTALCLVIIYLSKLKYLRNSDKLLILLTPFISEIGQYLFIIPGTFDWFDILTYLSVIIILNTIFPLSLIPFNMEKIKSHILAVGVTIVFLIMAFACATTHYTAYRPPSDPCVHHAALNYSPVLVQINIDGSYTMKDLQSVQRSDPVYFMDALKSANPYKYDLANGVTPNLNIYITFNTDSYQHYGARVKLYVYDDNTWFDTATNYVDPYKLLDDIAAKVNGFVTNGWQHGNCSIQPVATPVQTKKKS